MLVPEEGLIACTSKHEHLDRTIAVGLLANRGKPLVHGEGEGIPGLRPVENDPPDPVLALKNEVFRTARPAGRFPYSICFYIFEIRQFQAGTLTFPPIYAGNLVLAGLYASVTARIRRARSVTPMTPQRWTFDVQEHDAILNALQRRDGVSLSQILRAHLRHKREEVLQAGFAETERGDLTLRIA
jgi:hypothetical protein